jgi:hypothetical protein
VPNNLIIVEMEVLIKSLHSRLFSENTRKKGETLIVSIAIISFILHLLLIALVYFAVIQLDNPSYLLKNPIAAIYTPFSFILVYEVYLLIYYLPKSTTIYIGKQYEIITLIIIRRVFKDLSKLELSSDWFAQKNDVQFSYDLLATLILFFLIFVFYRLNDKKDVRKEKENVLSDEIVKFIRIKKIVALLLIPVFLVLSLITFSRLVYESFFSISLLVSTFPDVNKIFFEDFFTILILVDVLLLLFSFLHTDKFSAVIRNSGYIISTILIKLSFGTEGILNTVLIVVAVLFGVAILAIHNKYENISGAKNCT